MCCHGPLVAGFDFDGGWPSCCELTRGSTQSWPEWRGTSGIFGLNFHPWNTFDGTWFTSNINIGTWVQVFFSMVTRRSPIEPLTVDFVGFSMFFVSFPQRLIGFRATGTVFLEFPSWFVLTCKAMQVYGQRLKDSICIAQTKNFTVCCRAFKLPV